MAAATSASRSQCRARPAIEPGFPLGGGYSAPLVVQPTGRVDVLYIHHPTDQGTRKVHPGYEYFTTSRGGTGVAYIGWQTSAPKPGYATYLRPFSIRKGWLGPAVRVSGEYGNVSVWPGDSFGISALPGPGTRFALTWGSAIGGSKLSEIYAADVTLRP